MRRGESRAQHNIDGTRCYHVDVFKAQLTRPLTVNARAIRLQIVQATL